MKGFSTKTFKKSIKHCLTPLKLYINLIAINYVLRFSNSFKINNVLIINVKGHTNFRVSVCLGIKYFGTSANFTGILYYPGPGTSSFFWGDLSALGKEAPLNVLFAELRLY